MDDNTYHMILRIIPQVQYCRYFLEHTFPHRLKNLLCPFPRGVNCPLCLGFHRKGVDLSLDLSANQKQEEGGGGI